MVQCNPPIGNLAILYIYICIYLHCWLVACEPTGLLVNPLAARGNKIDLLNVMSYDASNAYDPVVALTAYRAIYSGQINMGVEVPRTTNPPRGARGHVSSLECGRCIPFHNGCGTRRCRRRPGAAMSTLSTPSSASARL